jgi:Protein of unknown function (DUF2934)
MIISALEYIKKAAYYLWLSEGRPEGRDKEHWERAENSLLMTNEGNWIPVKFAKTVEIRNWMIEDILRLMRESMVREINREIERQIFGI